MTDPIIGLIGHARSGKDTFAARLTTRHGYTRIAFADPLKEVAYDCNPYVDWDLDDEGGINAYALDEVIDFHGWEHAKDINPEIRAFLQNLGTALRDNIDPDIWLNAGLRKIEQTPGPVVVTDVRYPNEARAIRRMGGKLVRIRRPGFDGANGHDSEHLLDDWEVDTVVLNATDVEGLQKSADAIAVLYAQ